MPDGEIDVMLRRIGQRVLEDVWMSARTRLMALAVVATLAGAVAFGWSDASARASTMTPGVAMCSVAVTMSAIAAAASAIALLVRRFRWCCAAVYAGAISTVAAVGLLWWHQTTPNVGCPGPSAWMVVNIIGCAGLTAVWLRVTLTPLDQSQPDLRNAAVDPQVVG